MTVDHPKLAGLVLIQATYKKVDDHEIRTDILIPKKPYTGKRPVIIRFHGGGLVTGDSLIMDWWSHWVSDLAVEKDAIIISPNYRLLPSVNSAQIYEDIEDFWSWVHSSAFADLLTAHSTEADLDRILSAGESAGGLLSIYLALAHDIRACTAAYPCDNLSSEAFTTPRTVLPFGADFPESLVQETIDSISGVESSVMTEARLHFMVAAVQHGRIGGLYEAGVEGDLETRYPLVRLEKDRKVPPGGIAIIHGRQDSVVPVGESENFVARAREILKGKPGGDRVFLSVQEGEHGFDSDVRYQEPWLQDTLKVAVTTWLE